MTGWDTMFEWGRRASDRATSASADPIRDLMLEGAIAHEQIEVLFQPLIEPTTGRIVGAEALARSPIVPMRKRCLRGLRRRGSKSGFRAWFNERPCALLRFGKARSGTSRISINLLPQDLARQNFEQWLLEEISNAGINPKRVTVEITESALLLDRPAAAERLTQLRAEGITIAVDDFGTGYASLAYLTSLPLDMLKIDRGLITDIVGGTRDRIVVKAMIRLARDSGFKVVVEGVESTASWRCSRNGAATFTRASSAPVRSPSKS